MVSRILYYRRTGLLILFFLISAFIFASCGGGGSGVDPASSSSSPGSTPTDTTLPQVNSTYPGSGATNLSENCSVTAAFTEQMDASSINSSTFQLKDAGGTLVNGTVSLINATTAIFSPGAPLANSATFTATITTGAKDIAGNPLQMAFAWSFTTATVQLQNQLTVISTSPSDAETNVSPLEAIQVAFSAEHLDPTTLNNKTFLLKDASGNLVNGTVSPLDSSVIFRPSAPLNNFVSYTATLMPGIKTIFGYVLYSAYSWKFTTGNPLTISAQDMGNLDIVSINNLGEMAVVVNGVVNLRTVDGQLISTGIPNSWTCLHCLNDLSQIVVSANDPIDTFLWDPNNGITNVAWPAALANCGAAAINNSDQVVGNYSYYVDGYGAVQAFIWTAQNGATAIANGAGEAQALGINNSGQVTGGYYPVVGYEGYAFLWSAAQGMQNLGALGGTGNSLAYAINDSGQVVGWSNSLAFLWTASSGMVDIGKGLNCEAFGINDVEQVVGECYTPNELGFIWSPTAGLQFLPPLNGYTASSATSINNNGQIIGVSWNVINGVNQTPRESTLWTVK